MTLTNILTTSHLTADTKPGKRVFTYTFQNKSLVSENHLELHFCCCFSPICGAVFPPSEAALKQTQRGTALTKSKFSAFFTVSFFFMKH